MIRVCVLISGRGSNMEALVRNADIYTVETVISNRPDAPGLKVAEESGVRCVVEPSLDNIRDILDDLSPDLVCMAGFMKILPADITECHRIMNIHPSLLPKYPGLRSPQQALDDGATHSGCTVHFADGGVDTGKIIAQAVVEVKSGDAPATLAARILKWEHRLYAEAVRWYARQPAVWEQMEMTGEMEAASYATKMGTAYIRRSGTSYVASPDRPDTLPYVVATPGDTIDVVVERMGRLAAPAKSA